MVDRGSDLGLRVLHGLQGLGFRAPSKGSIWVVLRN